MSRIFFSASNANNNIFQPIDMKAFFSFFFLTLSERASLINMVIKAVYLEILKTQYLHAKLLQIICQNFHYAQPRSQNGNF